VNLRFRNKRALVTGCSRGIGAAIVSRLVHEGVDLARTYINRAQEAENTSASVRETGARVLTIQADSAMPGALAAVVQKTADVFGGVDILRKHLFMLLPGMAEITVSRVYSAH
jgi:3-oxoacyl-[acyl-carrier protein] reductase